MTETNISALPDLTKEYALTASQIADFQQNGHILLRNVASSDEVTAYRSVITNAALAYNTEKRALAERDTYGKAFLQIMNLWRRDEGVRRFVLARRFARIAADLLGVENVRIYHDQALYKEAGGGPTPWHQDEYYWPLDTEKTITLWMPLVDASTEMGVMSFISTSQKLGFLGEFAISDESQAVFERMIAEKNLSVKPGVDMAAGDATFHYGWTLHNASGNSTETMREVMTIIYFADGARITSPTNSYQENDRRSWLGGLQPGELATSELNPALL
ncbi:SnoK [Ktedonobacter sp. SOSP1-85]|uniref:phytanoyl-CoA dioxygenase family protein n=1 Tax=Ktedonobacter sp. SOSP1-85 TaxID=2778367 RepID=UPI0019161A40|nr:phytanoyl-CoA dioxygenase family protein [Ktedonobacter sp. SOSP1-85]GHO74836.1 SnoK [Ktedonobacter sp. SOSP1-85]